MRQLASIQRILNISPIEGADNIVVAQVLGWNVVVKKDEFKVGDLVVYCEIDSILPPKPQYDFLKKVNYRIKTKKIRGVISMGLIISIEDFSKSINGKIVHENDDLYIEV